MHVFIGSSSKQATRAGSKIPGRLSEGLAELKIIGCTGTVTEKKTIFSISDRF